MENNYNIRILWPCKVRKFHNNNNNVMAHANQYLFQAEMGI